MTTNKVTSLTTKKATPIPATVQSIRGGIYSVNMVCAKGNRKSLTLSKKLAEHLALTSSVYVTAYGDDGSIALSPDSIDDNSVKYDFSNDHDFIVYNAALVQFLAVTFNLNYEGKTSMSFRNIKLGSINGIPYAEVILAEKPTVTLCDTETEQEEQGDGDDSNT